MSEQQPAEPASPSDPSATALPPHPGPVPPQYAGQVPPSPPSPYPTSGQGQPARHPAPGQAPSPAQPQVPYPGQYWAPGPHPGQYPAQASAPTYPGAGQYPAQASGPYVDAPPYAYPQREAPTFAAPYASPPRTEYVAPPSTGGSALGIVALIAGLAALIIAPTIAAFAGYSVGVGLGDQLALRQSPSDIDISVLAPVRDAVLWGEIAFWAGTVLGIWAIVQGIVAIVKRRGRGPGIAAVVAAALGPIAFLIVLYGFVWAGIAASGSLGW